MAIVDPTTNQVVGDSVFGRGSRFAATHVWMIRGVAGVSLVAATAAGALGTGHWLSDHARHHASAAPSPSIPRRIAPQAAPLVMTPAPPMRAILTAGDTGGIANWGWAPSRSVTLRVSLVGLRESVPVRAQAQIAP